MFGGRKFSVIGLGVLSKVLTLGDSGSKLTDLLGLFLLEKAAVDVGSGSFVPGGNGAASSALAVMMGVPSSLLGVGQCLKVGGAVTVDSESSL